MNPPAMANKVPRFGTRGNLPRPPRPEPSQTFQEHPARGVDRSAPMRHVSTARSGHDPEWSSNATRSMHAPASRVATPPRTRPRSGMATRPRFAHRGLRVDASTPSTHRHHAIERAATSRHASRLKQYKFGRSLKTGEHVIVVGARGIWSVLPPIPGDDLRHLGRRSDGSTVPVVPGQLYEMAVVEVERSER
jgi:hypothetical protein